MFQDVVEDYSFHVFNGVRIRRKWAVIKLDVVAHVYIALYYGHVVGQCFEEKFDQSLILKDHAVVMWFIGGYVHVYHYVKNQEKLTWEKEMPETKDNLSHE